MHYIIYTFKIHCSYTSLAAVENAKKTLNHTPLHFCTTLPVCFIVLQFVEQCASHLETCEEQTTSTAMSNLPGLSAFLKFRFLNSRNLMHRETLIETKVNCVFRTDVLLLLSENPRPDFHGLQANFARWPR